MSSLWKDRWLFVYYPLMSAFWGRGGSTEGLLRLPKPVQPESYDCCVSEVSLDCLGFGITGLSGPLVELLKLPTHPTPRMPNQVTAYWLFASASPWPKSCVKHMWAFRAFKSPQGLKFIFRPQFTRTVKAAGTAVFFWNLCTNFFQWFLTNFGV